VAAVGSLKVLDPKWPIREADSSRTSRHVRKVLPKADTVAFQPRCVCATVSMQNHFENNISARLKIPEPGECSHGRSAD
jgi:hypothetical protein